MMDELLEARQLAARLRRVRLEHGLSLRGAAAQIGVTKETLSDLERARRHPHPPTLAKIAEGYGVEISALLGPMVEEPEAALASSASSPKSEGPTEGAGQAKPAQASEYWSRVERLAEGLAEGYGVPVEDLFKVPDVARVAKLGEAAPSQAALWRSESGAVAGRTSRERAPELLLEQLHEHGIQTNLSEVSILSQIIGISDELVEEEPIEWEQIGWLLAYTLAYDMLTQDEIEAARAALRRKVVESA